MPKFSEDTLNSWRMPPSDTEETKLCNAERMVKDAIYNDPVLSKMKIEVFGQGSYANDTNVRLNSDIDINVRYMDAFYFDLPKGKTRSDYGFDAEGKYLYPEFKNAVEKALVGKFGRDCVIRNDKCLTIEANSNRIETDVVPTFNYKYFSENGGSRQGSKFKADSGNWVVNYPLQHIANGKLKNSETQKRFKRLTRIFRKVRYKMKDDKYPANESITSFLLECLVWNVPDGIFNNYSSWTDRTREAIRHLYVKTKDEEICKKWTEVSKGLYLFTSNRKWSSSDVNAYMVSMWRYLDFK